MGRLIKRDVVSLWFAARDNRTPFTAKLVAGAVAAYALSPVDLIIVPSAIMLAVSLIPNALIDEFRARAAQQRERPKNPGGLAAILGIWLTAAILFSWWSWKYFVHDKAY